MDEGYTSEEGWHRETQSVKKKNNSLESQRNQTTWPLEKSKKRVQKSDIMK